LVERRFPDSGSALKDNAIGLASVRNKKTLITATQATHCFLLRQKQEIELTFHQGIRQRRDRRRLAAHFTCWSRNPSCTSFDSRNNALSHQPIIVSFLSRTLD